MTPLSQATEEQFDMAIAFDGTWLHQGAPMTRMPLVRLFATVLRRDAAGDYWLVTPIERGRIQVADAPFIAVSARFDAQGLSLTDNLGREIPVDTAHPLTLRAPLVGGGPAIPYHQLGFGIEARLATHVYYDLVDQALARSAPDDAGFLWFESFGGKHPVGCIA